MDRLGNEVAELAIDATMPRELLAALEGQPGHVVRSSSSVTIVSPESRQELTDRINALPLSELNVSSMTIRPATLNDVFLHLTANGDQPDLAIVAGSRA